MNIKSDSVGEKVYSPEVIDDKTEELIKLARDSNIRRHEQAHQLKLNQNIVQAIERQTEAQSNVSLNKQGTLIILVNEGDVTYTANALYRTYKAHLKPTGNSYKLLMLLAGMPGKKFSAKEIAKVLNPPRYGAENASEERRVSDTIAQIKENLKIPTEDNFIEREKNNFGITCTVELKPE